MLKKILASCILGAAAISAIAADASIDFTYASDEYSIWGKGKSEIYDVAIRINDPALVGKKITSIRALLNAWEDIESTSLWLSKELTLEKVGSVKVNVPDTYSADVAPEKISLPNDKESYGQLSASLEEPYVITEEGIYVGYSLTVPPAQKGTALTNKQSYPLLLSPGENSNGLYLRASKDFLKWMPYSDKLGACAMIYVTLEGEFAEYSVGVNSIASTYAPANKDFYVNAEITTPGANDVSSIGYTYTIGGKNFEGNLNFDDPIPSSLINATSVYLPIEPISELGTYTLELNINKVNGRDNENPKSSASADVTVLPYVPQHRPMLEEFTGTWCGWCTRGYYALEKLNEIYGDNIVLAAYHDGDPMQVDATPVKVDGYPSATLNRNGMEDPYYGKANDGFGMKKEVEESMGMTVPVDIQVKAVWGNANKTEIKVESTSTFFEDNANAGYKVGYILINNGLSGATSNWAQSNYFAQYAANYIGTDLEVLTTWPAKVPGLIFNDVVVDVDGMLGVENSLPSAVAFNESYASEFAYDIASNSIIQDKDKLYVAAFIINPNGTILNANKAKVVSEDTSAVKGIQSGVEVSAEYYNLSGIRVEKPQNGVFVKVAKMSDGSIRTSKEIVR